MVLVLVSPRVAMTRKVRLTCPFVHAAADRDLREAHRREARHQRQQPPFRQAQIELLQIGFGEIGTQGVRQPRQFET